MTSDEVRGALAHRVDVERRGDVPDLPALERRRGAAVEDPVEVAAADAGEARVPVVGDRLDVEHRDRVAAAPARSGLREGGAAVSASAMSTWALIASAWTPASVRPAAVNAAGSPVMRCSASSSACCTDGPWSCRCQPMNGPPSYSMVSRQRVTAGSCPWGSRSRAAAPRGSSAPVRRAGRRSGRIAPSPQAIVSRSSSTSPGAPAVMRQLGFEQLDPLAISLEPGAGGGSEGADLPLDLLGGLAPVDPRLGLVDLGGVGDAVVGLRLAAGSGWRASRATPLRRISPVLP